MNAKLIAASFAAWLVSSRLLHAARRKLKRGKMKFVQPLRHGLVELREIDPRLLTEKGLLLTVNP